MVPTATPDLTPFWRELARRQHHAAWGAALLLGSTALFITFLDQLWRPPFEVAWASLAGLLTLHLIWCQWRLASLECPRCGGSWTEGLWRLPNPFSLHHPRCPHCGLDRREGLKPS